MSKAPLFALGLTLALTPFAAAQEAILTVDGPQAGSEFGYAVGPAGDVDGDGRADVVVGAPYYDGAVTNQGQAYVISSVDGSAIFTFTGQTAEATLGASVSGGGDVDGNGVPDVVLGAPNLTIFTAYGTGRVFVYSGSDGSKLFGVAPSNMICTSANVKFGQSVTALRDFDGDGVDDVAFGQDSDLCDFAGTTSVFAWFQDSPVGREVWTLGCGCWCGASWGDAVDTGDMNGDGLADVVFGYRGDFLFGTDNDRGIHVRLGPDGASGWSVSLTGSADGHEWVTGLGDVNGDGNDDVAAAGVFDDNPGVAAVKIFSGVDGALLYEVLGLGTYVGRVDDVSGDGIGDLLVGNPSDATSGADAGAAYLVSGADGTVLSVFFGDGPGDRFGAALYGVGDATGDGVPDFAVGAPGSDYVRLFSGVDLPAPFSYCTGKVSSQGCTPSIDWGGSPTMTGPDDFLVITRDGLVGKPGLFFYGTSGQIAVPFLGGTLCVLPPLSRTIPTNAAGPADCDAGYAFHFSQALMLQEGMGPGGTVNGQYWMRDPANPDGTGVGLSDGIEFTLLP